MDALTSANILARAGCGERQGSKDGFDKLARSRSGAGKTRRTSTTASNPLQLAQGLLENVATPKVKRDRKQALEEEAKRVQHLRLKNAQTVEEWTAAAEKLDILEGSHWWKFEENSDECDMPLIRDRLNRLKRANNEGDIEEMMLQIRTSLKRDLGGMTNIPLFQHTRTGTKTLIEEYTEVVKYTIDQIAKACEFASDMDIERYLHEMKAARQSFGNSALLLSGGGTLGMCHIGVVSCLLEADLLPRIISGSSAGSIVSAVICAKRGNEAVEALTEICQGDLDVFQGPDEMKGFPGMAYNIIKGEAACNAANLCRVMRRILGDITFKEAYWLTGRILNIHVSCRDEYNLPRLLNYQTAPNVILWSAVASSCAVPGLFKSPGLKAKDPDTGAITPWSHSDLEWVDGSIEGDLPAQLLERLFNVNNFIVSQVNPHVVPFIEKDEHKSIRKSRSAHILRSGLKIAKQNTLAAMENANQNVFNFFPLKAAYSILSQKYDGDITILPDISWVKWSEVLANPSKHFIMEAARQGERATWPKLTRIRSHVAIELALDYGIKQIQMIQLGSEQSPKNFRRAISSTRSERGLHHQRRESGTRFANNLRPIRGRGGIHRSARSMLDSPFVPKLVLPTNIAATLVDHPVSSSDETRSGRSTPITSYEDEDYLDVKHPPRPSTPRWRNTQSAVDLKGFISQPPTPSIASQTFQFTSDTHPPAPSGPVSDRRKLLEGLRMSSLASIPTTSDRKKPRQ